MSLCDAVCPTCCERGKQDGEIALQEVVTGKDQNSEVRVSSCWKLSTLLPRLLLHRLPRGGLVPRRQLEERFGESSWQKVHQFMRKPTKGHHRQDDEERLCNPRSLVHMGEQSAVRKALEAVPVAPRTMATLRKLTDPERRPPVAREKLCLEVVDAVPERAFQLDLKKFLVCVCGKQGEEQLPVHRA